MLAGKPTGDSDAQKKVDARAPAEADREPPAEEAKPGALYWNWVHSAAAGGSGDENPEARRRYFGAAGATVAAMRGMERAFGASFERVRLRADPDAAARAASLGYRAYTDGHEIGFAAGAFAPGTREGRRVLAHELAHVVQARGGQGGASARPAIGGPGAHGYTSSPGDGDAAEADAHQAAQDVDAGRTPSVGGFEIHGVMGHNDPPPKGSFDVTKSDGGGVSFGISGATFKSWANPLAECFKRYVRLAYAGVTGADVDACTAAATLSWVTDPTKTPPADNDTITIDILPTAQAEADKWMKANGRTYAKVEPKSGSYKVDATPTGGGGQTGTKGTSPEGEVLRLFQPVGEIAVVNEIVPVLTGTEINVLFHFTGDEEGKLYNYYPFVNRVDYTWTIKRGGVVVDSGPLFKGGSIDYVFSVENPGTHTIDVSLTSRYFRDAKPYSPKTRTFEAQTEEKRRAEVFSANLVGPEADKPFEAAPSGGIKVKADAKGSASAIDDELVKMWFELGLIAKSTEIPVDKRTEYVDYYTKRIEALKAVQAKMGQGNDYVVAGVFVNRDDSRAMNMRTTMTGRRLGVDGGRAQYAVAAYDVTISNEAIQHSGTSTGDASTSEAAGYAEAENKAIDAMASDWHWYNDFPDGSIQLGVGLKEGSGVKTVVIDTHNVKRPLKKVLTGVVIVGSLALAVGSGGTLAPMAVLAIEVATTAAGIALTADSIATRIDNGTFRMDAQLVLDMLSLVPFAGTLARSAGALTKNGMRILNLAVMGATAVAIADATRMAIRDCEALYAGKIAAAPTDEEKKRLEKERDRAIAQILGGAAATGGLMLITVAAAAKAGPVVEPEVPQVKAPPGDTVLPVEPPKPVVEPPKPAVVEPPKPAVVEPPKPAVVEPPKPVVEPPKPAVVEPPKPAVTEPPKPAVEPPKPAVTEPPTPEATAVPVTQSGPNWGIPEGGIPISERAKVPGAKIRDYALKNPEQYYYDPKTGQYPRRIGFPIEPGAGHAIPCFPAGTFVMTPAGGRLIELIEPGDVVYGYDEAAGRPTPRRVLEKHVSRTEWLFRVETDTGEVRATGDHRFWVGPGEWVAARDLEAWMALRTFAGERLPLRSAVAVEVPAQPTYNLTVEVDFNYFAGDERVLVHNDGPFGVYLGRDPVTGAVIYAGQTEQSLVTRQAQHRAEALANPGKYAGKTDVTLEWARGPDGKLLTNLSDAEAHYWERMVYDRGLLAGGSKLVNRQIPYTDESMAELITKSCPK